MSYEERRVRVKVYNSLPRGSSLLVDVPSVPGKACKLHTLAAASLRDMSEAVARDLGFPLAIVSGWRPHRWKSREHYESEMVRRYGSVAEGKKWMAYASPHETGLAIDIGVGGLWPDRKTRDAQREQPLHAWLVENAWSFGWHPYKREPWHWEHPLPISAYQSGSR